VSSGIKVVKPDLRLISVAKANTENFSPSKVSAIFIQEAGNSKKTENIFELPVAAGRDFLISDLKL
jgi:hypothetical protein